MIESLPFSAHSANLPSFLQVVTQSDLLTIDNWLAKSIFRHILHKSKGEPTGAARQAGLCAGEDYAINYLDLQVPLEVFLQALSQSYSQTGLPKGEIIQESRRTVTVGFTHWDSCCQQGTSTAALLYEFGAGFLQGIFESYTNQACRVTRHCRPIQARANQPGCMYRIVF